MDSQGRGPARPNHSKKEPILHARSAVLALMVEVKLVHIARRMLEPPFPRGSDNRVQVGMGWHPAKNLLGPAGIGH
jgi:hypothetical protein